MAILHSIHKFINCNPAFWIFVEFQFPPITLRYQSFRFMI